MPDLAPALCARIAAEGPLPLETVMAEAVAAYYAEGRAFGRAGDFVTAPEISQVFGELVGVWMALRWIAAGRPPRVVLCECGPGRGTLIADLLRAAQSVPGFADAIELHLVETSAALRATQKTALGGFPARWHDDFAALPTDAPLLLVANEFLDALPVRQMVRRGATWRAVRVGLAEDGLGFVDGPETLPPPDLVAALPPPAEGDVIEHRPAAEAFARDLGHRLAAQGGAALLFDYGPAESGYGDSLQAVRRHACVPLLETPGAADLSAHVDFARVAAAARPAAAFGPAPQGRWLVAMGLRERTAQLAANATPEQARALASGAARLCEAPAMGRLFKALALLPPGADAPEGFGKS
ncbi:conserved hypothetical protein [uncultured Alphaproteobacteria bacterium]|uniref:ATP synthase beta subunit/transription termination factor rho n=1 Tax=uncultured Alphaproteobacteria bacterium TaxID=91750 RepID=A0A212JWF4_9PROT|nr:conserved hypothetical protein [uncultured Alphaproteobacteria bacterium]